MRFRAQRRTTLTLFSPRIVLNTMSQTIPIRQMTRAAALALWGIWIFGIMLPNLGPFPELQSTPEEARRAEVLRGTWIAGYSLGFLLASGCILVGGKRNTRWEKVGWLVLVGLSLPPVSKVFPW